MSDNARLSVPINPETRAVLTRAAPTFTEAVRRAAAIYDLIDSAIALGARVRIVAPDGAVRDIVLTAPATSEEN